MEFIRGITLVHLKIRCWSGEKKADRSRDIRLGTDGSILPEKLLDLGRKKIFPPESLKVFRNLRREAERACLATGTRFMGGFAINDVHIEQVEAKLQAVEVAYNEAVAKFMVDFERKKAQWVEENKEYSEFLSDITLNHESVKNTFCFKFKCYKLEPLDGHEPEEDEIANQVLHEIGLTCREMSDRMLERKKSISGKNLCGQLDPIIKKLDTMSFGNGRILKVLAEFKSMQASIPSEILDREPPSYCTVITFLSMCSDSNKLERIIEGSLSVNKLLDGIRKTVAKEALESSESERDLFEESNCSTPASSLGSSGAYF